MRSRLVSFAALGTLLFCLSASAAWKKNLSCGEVGPKNSAMVMEYKLQTTSAHSGLLDIDGFQTMSRYAVRLEDKKTELLIYFEADREPAGSRTPSYKKGDLLFRLQHRATKKTVLKFEKIKAVFNEKLTQIDCD